jgi:uncharacterized protein
MKNSKKIKCKAARKPAVGTCDAYLWEAGAEKLVPVERVARLPLALLLGIDAARDTLLENTRRFAGGLPANNALLWGARGMGKSSLIKAVHAEVNRNRKAADRLALIEIHREDIATLPKLLRLLRGRKRRYLLFCDDLSFDSGDTSYKSLKAALEGGIEGRPENVLFYATSNRRHLMAREGIENDGASLTSTEAAEERISLSDRFGLWLGFHHCGQDEFLAMIDSYCRHFGLDVPAEAVRTRAIAWAAMRGNRSGRVAWQFVQDLAGELGKPMTV